MMLKGMYQIFKSGIQQEFFKLKYTHKVKDLGIKVSS